MVIRNPNTTSDAINRSRCHCQSETKIGQFSLWLFSQCVLSWQWSQMIHCFWGSRSFPVLATTASQDRSTIVDDHRRRSALIHHEEDDLTVSEYNYRYQIEATFKDSFLFLSPSNSSIVAEWTVIPYSIIWSWWQPSFCSRPLQFLLLTLSTARPTQPNAPQVQAFSCSTATRTTARPTGHPYKNPFKSRHAIHFACSSCVSVWRNLGRFLLSIMGNMMEPSTAPIVATSSSIPVPSTTVEVDGHLSGGLPTTNPLDTRWNGIIDWNADAKTAIAIWAMYSWMVRGPRLCRSNSWMPVHRRIHEVAQPLICLDSASMGHPWHFHRATTTRPRMRVHELMKQDHCW